MGKQAVRVTCRSCGGKGQLKVGAPFREDGVTSQQWRQCPVCRGLGVTVESR